jgi:hypothetical protein
MRAVRAARDGALMEAKAKRHRTLVSVLLVAAVITGFIGMFAVWANRQALNTDNWTHTSSRLLEDDHIRTAVGAYLVDQLFQNVDVAGEIRQVLPRQAQALAGPAAAGLRQLADQRAPIFLARPRVQEAWRTANRAAHKELLSVINGGGKSVSTQNGEVVLNLRTLIDQLASDVGVSEQVAAARSKLQGSSGAQARALAQQKLGLQLPASAGQLVILKSDQLSTVQDGADALRSLAVLFTIIPVALFALAVWLADGWRRVALRTAGWCFVGLGLTVLIARRAVGDRVVDGLVSADSVKPAAHSAWTIGTSLLYDIAVAMLFYGIVLVLAAWLAGPTRAAVGLRRAMAPSLRYHMGMVWGFVAVVFLLLILWGPTPATRKPLGILFFAVLLALGVELLRRHVDREYPDVRPGETAERMRQWARGVRSRRRSEPPAPAPVSVEQRFDEIERLAALHDRGVLTDAEFDTGKEQLLRS